MTRGKEVFFVLKRTMQSVFRVGSKHSSMKQQKTRSERAYGSNRGTHITKQTKDLHLMPVEKKKKRMYQQQVRPKHKPATQKRLERSSNKTTPHCSVKALQ